MSKHNFSIVIEINFDKFTESRRVVVFESFSITESFKNWIGFKHLLFNTFYLTTTSSFSILRDVQEIEIWTFESSGSLSKIAKNNLSRFSFTSPRFSGNDNSLGLFFNHHLIISVFCDHENMRFLLSSFQAFLHIFTFLSVSSRYFCVEEFREFLIWINSNQNRRTNISVDLPVEESCSDNMQQRAFVKFTEIKKVTQLF